MQQNSISDYKNMAIASLKGKWGISATMFLIYSLIYIVIVGVFNLATGTRVGDIVALILLPMAWGVTITFLNVSRGGEVDLGNLTIGYKDFSRIFLTTLLKNVYILLWTLLLIVPGIIKSYSYAMTDFIMKDDPEIKYDKAIVRSMDMMKGHKMDLFLLDLSFIGWAILCIITLGIGIIFLSPYMLTTRAHFYENLLKGDEAQPQIEE